MRHSPILPLVLMLGAIAATPQPAGADSGTPQQAEAPQTAIEQLMERYYTSLSEGRLAAAEAAVAALRKNIRNRAVGDAFAMMMRSPIAAARGKDDEARDLFAKGEAALPNAHENFEIILYASLLVKKSHFAGHVLDRFLARAPDLARKLPPQWVYATLREPDAGSETVENRRISLAEIGFGDQQGDELTASAIGTLLNRGEVDRAKSLLRYVDAPRVVEDMLIQRSYAPIWPLLAEQVGPRLANSRQSSVQHALQAHVEKPEDNEALADLISAYRYAQRFDEAIALRAKLPKTPAEFAAADQDMGWAINNLALALYSAGQADEADRLFASLNDALPANSWRVSMFINRVDLLVQNGRFEAALPLIAVAEAERKSPYAEQLLRRLRYCVLSRLKRTAEAAALRPAMIAHAKDALGPTVDGLVCAGELDEAERLALGSLDRPGFQRDFVRLAQHTPLTADDPPVWGGWTALRTRPAVAAAFDRLGRDLPAELRAENIR